MAVGASDGTITLLDSDGGQISASKLSSLPVGAIDVSANGQYVAASVGKTVNFLEASALQQPINTPHAQTFLPPPKPIDYTIPIIGVTISLAVAILVIGFYFPRRKKEGLMPERRTPLGFVSAVLARTTAIGTTLTGFSFVLVALLDLIGFNNGGRFNVFPAQTSILDTVLLSDIVVFLMLGFVLILAGARISRMRLLEPILAGIIVIACVHLLLRGVLLESLANSGRASLFQALVQIAGSVLLLVGSGVTLSLASRRSRLSPSLFTLGIIGIIGAGLIALAEFLGVSPFVSLYYLFGLGPSPHSYFFADRFAEGVAIVVASLGVQTYVILRGRHQDLPLYIISGVFLLFYGFGLLLSNISLLSASSSTISSLLSTLPTGIYLLATLFLVVCGLLLMTSAILYFAASGKVLANQTRPSITSTKITTNESPSFSELSTSLNEKSR